MDMTKSDASISGISVHQVQLASTLRGLASILEARPLAGHELAIIDVNIHQLSKSLGHNRLKHQYEGSSVRITKLLPRIRASPEKRPLTRLNRETLPPNKASLAFRRFGTLHGDLERSCLTESGIQRELFLDSPLPISMQGGLLEEINVLHEPQGHVYSTTDQLEQGPPTPKIMHHLQSRLENLVSQFLLCQERAKNIAILASHTTDSAASRMDCLKSVNLKLRDKAEISTSGLRVLTARMRVFEERLQEFDGVSEPDQERGTVVARMRHHIQDWRINYHSIMKQLSSEPNSRKNDANEPDQWESETVRVGTSIHRAGINFDGTELVSNLDEDGSQIEDDWIEAYMSP